MHGSNGYFGLSLTLFLNLMISHMHKTYWSLSCVIINVRGHYPVTVSILQQVLTQLGYPVVPDWFGIKENMNSYITHMLKHPILIRVCFN